MRKFGCIQQVVENFYLSTKKVVVVSIMPGAYSSLHSAQGAYRSSIKKLGYSNSIAVRVINGDVYLIKIQNPSWSAKNYSNICSDCIHRYPSDECASCRLLSNYVSKRNNAGSKKEVEA